MVYNPLVYYNYISNVYTVYFTVYIHCIFYSVYTLYIFKQKYLIKKDKDQTKKTDKTKQQVDM